MANGNDIIRMVVYGIKVITSMVKFLVIGKTIGVEKIYVKNTMQDKKPTNEQGLAHGVWERYYQNNQLSYKGLCLNGRRFGLHESFYEDGRLHYKCYYINNNHSGYHEDNLTGKKKKRYYAR
jgi:antitoxin component YwqK of YwqJK toxin-antitoxin module